MRLLPLRGVSGSLGLVVFGGVVGHCSSNPFPKSGVARVGNVQGLADKSAAKGAGVAGGTATLNATLGTVTGVATVAGEAGVADVLAGAVPDLEACGFSAELFLSCVALSIFWRGFANAPTFPDFLNISQEEVEWPDTLQRKHAFWEPGQELMTVLSLP
jgi:hypothetical protein